MHKIMMMNDDYGRLSGEKVLDVQSEVHRSIVYRTITTEQDRMDVSEWITKLTGARDLLGIAELSASTRSPGPPGHLEVI